MKASGMRGETTILLLAALLLIIAIITALSRLFAGIGRNWQLFDRERQSLVFCERDLEELVELGPEDIKESLPGELAALCLPRRSDHGARGREVSEAICVLEEAMVRPPQERICQR